MELFCLARVKKVSNEKHVETKNLCCLAGRTSHNTGVLPTLLQRGGKVRMLEHTHKIIMISTDGKEIHTQR